MDKKNICTGRLLYVYNQHQMLKIKTTCTGIVWKELEVYLLGQGWANYGPRDPLCGPRALTEI